MFPEAYSKLAGIPGRRWSTEWCGDTTRTRIFGWYSRASCEHGFSDAERGCLEAGMECAAFQLRSSRRILSHAIADLPAYASLMHILLYTQIGSR